MPVSGNSCVDCQVLQLRAVNIKGFDTIFAPGRAIIEPLVAMRQELHRAATEFRSLCKVPGPDQSVGACVRRIQELRPELQLTCCVTTSEGHEDVSVAFVDPGDVEEQLRSLRALCAAMSYATRVGPDIKAQSVALCHICDETRWVPRRQ